MTGFWKWFKRGTDWLSGRPGAGDEEQEESRMAAGVGARASGRMELPFTDVGETVAGAGLLFGD